jgi:hypothetical protein
MRGWDRYVFPAGSFHFPFAVLFVAVTSRVLVHVADHADRLRPALVETLLDLGADADVAQAEAAIEPLEQLGS